MVTSWTKPFYLLAHLHIVFQIHVPPKVTVVYGSFFVIFVIFLGPTLSSFRRLLRSYACVRRRPLSPLITLNHERIE